MIRLILLISLILLEIDVYSQNLSFYRENITMKIDGQDFYVSGTYYFRYDLTDTKLLHYPFPTGEMYGNPDSIYLFDLTNNATIKPLEIDSSMLLFLVDFSSSPEVSIQISYKQPLRSDQAEYILETTQVWGKPFEEATYQLIVPSYITIQSFSITPSDSIMTGFDKVYTWEKYNYMPEQNMIFKFVENK
jgi:hypothetical protein